MNRLAFSSQTGARLFAVAGWCLAYGLLFLVSRANHPTLALNAIASLVFVLCAFAATSLNAHLLLPAIWRRGSQRAYVLIMTLMLAATTFFVVVSIRTAYRLLWFDDPRMFGFWNNMGLDFVVIGILFSVATTISLLFQRSRAASAQQETVA
jgi:hypothetical protein